jgi:glucokinase
MLNNFSIGVDIGGSHISCAAVDLQNRKILRETLTELPVDNKGEAEDIIDTWSDAIRRCMGKLDASQLKGIGFAMPGPFDYVNGICLIKGVQKYEKLYGCNVSEEISKSLDLKADQSVRFMNDASSFAVGEAWAGMAAGSNKSMAITLGTGFGSAFIENTVPVVTGDSVPMMGCVYHIKYRDGIADDYFSTRGFIERYREINGKDTQGVKSIADEAVGNAQVQNIFTEFGRDLGGFLAPFLIKFRAGVLVIGGNISRSFGLFGPSLEKALIENDCQTKTYTSVLKEDAALLGSAYMLDNDFWDAIKGSLQ